MAAPVIAPLGDQALLITCPDPLALAAAIERAAIAGVSDIVAASATVMLAFDPRVVSFERLRRAVRALPGPAAGGVSPAGNLLAGNPLAGNPLAGNPLAGAAAPREHRLPLRYDGPDLAEVAERCGLSVDQAIALHSGAAYRVALIGFLPGFPYLDGLPERLRLPRRATPRARVPAGSVAIAGPQTGIYPQASPGGWHILGTTAACLFDPDAMPPALLAAGDIVRFEPI